MSTWLIIEAELHFNEKLKPITSAYRADLRPADNNIYYGMHFIVSPAVIQPGERLTVQMVLRAYPEDPCADFQVGKKILLKEGPTLIRADGIVLRRIEHESPAQTLLELRREFQT